MVTFRQMTEDDVPAAVAAFESGLLGIAAGLGLPVTGNSIQDERRRQDRTRHFLGTDPGGSWVAEEGDTIVGMSQSFVREDYWMLSQLGTVPGRQGPRRGPRTARARALARRPGKPRDDSVLADPKAMALYTGFGFTLHPVVTAWGAMRPGRWHAPPRSTATNRTRSARASWTWSPPSIGRCAVGPLRRHRGDAGPTGNRLLLHADQGYAVAKDERIVTLGARQEESAALVLRAMLAEAPAGETIEVNWLTSAQQWAVREVVAAGIELRPYGPVMVRGMDGPPRPYIPSGGFG